MLAVIVFVNYISFYARSCPKSRTKSVRLKQQVQAFLCAAHQYIAVSYQAGTHSLAVHDGNGQIRYIKHLYIVESIAYAGNLAAKARTISSLHSAALALGNVFTSAPKPSHCDLTVP